jgi:hypothetical protein
LTPFKRPENPRTKWQSRGKTTRFYRSFRQNDGNSGRNPITGRELELRQAYVEFIHNAIKYLRPKTTVERMADYRKSLADSPLAKSARTFTRKEGAYEV